MLFFAGKPSPMITAQPVLHEPDQVADAGIRAALEDVKRRLWNDLADYVKRIRLLADSGDFEGIRLLGHTIKGFGGHLLRPQITELGRSIQTAVR
jgi:hypothetical protein